MKDFVFFQNIRSIFLVMKDANTMYYKSLKNDICRYVVSVINVHSPCLLTEFWWFEPHRGVTLLFGQFFFHNLGSVGPKGSSPVQKRGFYLILPHS